MGERGLHPLVEKRVERIAEDSRHGASWLAKEAVETLIEAVELGLDPLAVARTVVAARPSIGAIAGALGRVLGATVEPERMLEEARALLAGRERAAKTIAVLIQEELDGTVMTHSASATVREGLLYHPPQRVLCTVSEPIGEGRAFAAELARAGLRSELVADSDAEQLVTTVDLLLLGADTVFHDGSLANKVGTCRLAQAARAVGKRVVVTAEVIKLAPVVGRDPVESRFDLTPATAIDRFVTEEGGFAPDEIAALVDRTPFLHDGYFLLTGP